MFTRYLKNLALLFCCFGYAWTLSAQSPEARLANARQAYEGKRYAESAEIYEALLTEGYRDATLYYNLGNAYFRLDSLARARLAYERARLLSPGDEDTARNLDVLAERLPDQFEAIPAFFLRRWWEGLRDSLSSDTWAVLALMLVWLGVAGLILWLRGKERRHRQWGFLLGWIFLLLSLLPYFLASGREAVLRNSGAAVIMVEKVFLRSAPEVESRSLMPLHAGTKVELMDRISDWHKVHLPDGEQGWLPAASLETI